jgi:hypothetical protein
MRETFWNCKKPNLELPAWKKQKLERALAGIYCKKETKPEAASAGIYGRRRVRAGSSLSIKTWCLTGHAQVWLTHSVTVDKRECLASRMTALLLGKKCWYPQKHSVGFRDEVEMEGKREIPTISGNRNPPPQPILTYYMNWTHLFYIRSASTT